MSGAFVQAINDLDEEPFHPMTAMSPGVTILLPAELLPTAVLLGWSCILGRPLGAGLDAEFERQPDGTDLIGGLGHDGLSCPRAAGSPGPA
jgi:hypothetical protein